MHYVAHLKVENVEPRAGGNDRVIDTVTQITIKADTLETLVTRLGKHIQIIEEN